MNFFAYSFCMSMLHSFWQGALLWLVYYFYRICFKHQSPLAKRNFLFTTLITQSVLFILSFFLFFFNDGKNSEPFIFYGSIGNFIPSAESLYDISGWFFWGYCMIVLYKSIVTIYLWYNFRKNYITSLQKPSIDLKLFTSLKAYHLGIKKKVQIWYSNQISSPITFGFFKPVILLPVGLVNNISMQQAETLILHELSHIKVNDYLLNWVVLAIENIFFFNPFILNICKKIKLQRELHCDSTVMTYNYSPILYAETLLQIAKTRIANPVLSLGATSGKHQLFKRINYFTREENNKQTKNSPAVLSLFLSTYLILFFITLNTLVPVNQNAGMAKNIMVLPALVEQTELPVLFTTQTKAEKETPLSIVNYPSKVQPKKNITGPKLKTENLDESPGSLDFNSTTSIIPVSLSEKEKPAQVIINEEESGNAKSSVKVYNLVYVNGVWVLQPQWMMSKKELNKLSKAPDSTEPLLQEEFQQ